MPPKEIPDRWEPYIPIGSPVRGTRFIALKVPLKEHICAKLNPKFRWTINILTDTYPDIGMVVDLTLTTRYYDFVDVLNKGVDYCKVAIPGQQIPSESLVKRFFAAVDFYLDRRRDDSLIGVHCTHGVNRTGYMIARYMIQRLGFSVSDALESITVARGHPIERENYISDLGRHLEQLPKILDGSDIHKGRTAGEPPRVSLGIKATKKKKPLETRTGTEKERRPGKRPPKRIRARLKQLERDHSIKQTAAPCEVVVVDSSSEEDTGGCKNIQHSGRADASSGVPVEIPNQKELVTTETPLTSSVGAHEFSGTSYFAENSSRLAQYCDKMVNPIPPTPVNIPQSYFVESSSRLAQYCDKMVNPIPPMPVHIPQCAEPTTLGDAASSSVKIENTKSENDLLTSADDAKREFRVAIRVKDISLLTDQPLKSECKAVENLKIEESDSGIVSLPDSPSRENIAAPSTARDASGAKVEIRLRSISSLVSKAVQKRKSDIYEGKSVENCSRPAPIHMKSRKNFSSTSDFLKVNTSGIRNPVGPSPSVTSIEKPVVTNISIGNITSSSCNTSASANTRGESTSNAHQQPAKRKKLSKNQKAKKRKQARANTQHANPGFQNSSQPLQFQTTTSDQPSFSGRTPYFYTESRPTYTGISGSQNLNIGGKKTHTHEKQKHTHTKTQMRNKNLDRAVLQEMRPERRKMRKILRRQQKQLEHNRFCQDFYRSNSTIPHPQFPSYNQQNRQFGEGFHQIHPPPLHQIQGQHESWKDFGVASGLLSRDVPQRYFVPQSSSSYSRENSTSRASKSDDFKTVSEAGGSSCMPTANRTNSDNFIPLSSPKVEDCVPQPTAVPQTTVKTESIPSSSGSRTIRHTTSPKPSNSSNSSMPPNSDSSTKVSAASNPTIKASPVKLPWTALSDTSWSSLFYK